jgi:hypothetical protein
VWSYKTQWVLKIKQQEKIMFPEWHYWNNSEGIEDLLLTVVGIKLPDSEAKRIEEMFANTKQSKREKNNVSGRILFYPQMQHKQ